MYHSAWQGWHCPFLQFLLVFLPKTFTFSQYLIMFCHYFILSTKWHIKYDDLKVFNLINYY